MHEATRRLLGVLLRHLDGFETNKRSVVIAATNRKEDLDPALLSRQELQLFIFRLSYSDSAASLIVNKKAPFGTHADLLRCWA